MKIKSYLRSGQYMLDNENILMIFPIFVKAHLNLIMWTVKLYYYNLLKLQVIIWCEKYEIFYIEKVHVSQTGTIIVETLYIHHMETYMDI